MTITTFFSTVLISSSSLPALLATGSLPATALPLAAALSSVQLGDAGSSRMIFDGLQASYRAVGAAR